MIQRLKQVVLSLVAGAALIAPAMVPATVSAVTPDINSNLCGGTTLSATATCDAPTQGGTAGGRVNNIIATVINLFSLIVGVVSVIMIIIGGLKYITSGGDSGNVTGAKNTILYAVIGLVVVALAQVIVQFVLGRATQV